MTTTNETATTRPTSMWADHAADTDRDGMVLCGGRPRRRVAVVRQEAHECACYVGVRHTHCSGCGRLLSKGDWDAPPIAEFTLKLER